MLLGFIFALAAQAGAAGVDTVSREAMSYVDEPREVVVRTASEWTTLWRQHAGDNPAPTVDFAKRTVVAVFLGSRSTAGYAVEITGTRKVGSALVVEWREGKPDPGHVTAQIITSPAHLVSVPKFAGEIRFEKSER